MTPSVKFAGGRRVTRWTCESIIEKIADWNGRYGEPPCSADWNPSLARWRAQEWRVDRYYAGAWPSTNAVKRPFGGSFDAAARPDMPQRAPQAPRSVDDELLAAAAAVREAETRAAALERRLRVAERRADRAEEAVGEARRRARRATERE